MLQWRVQRRQLWAFTLLLTLRSAPKRASRRVGDGTGSPETIRTNHHDCSPPFETAARRPPQGEEQCETAKVGGYEWRAHTHDAEMTGRDRRRCAMPRIKRLSFTGLEYVF